MTAPRKRCDAPTMASAWQVASGSRIEDALLIWPPDVLALGALILERSYAYRIALSPPVGDAWPPAGSVGGRGDRRRPTVQQGDRAGRGRTPELLVREWSGRHRHAARAHEARPRLVPGAGGVTGVVFPGSAVDRDDIDPLEALVARHNVHGRIAGVRQSSPGAAKSPDERANIGVVIGDQSAAVALARRYARVALWWR